MKNALLFWLAVAALYVVSIPVAILTAYLAVSMLPIP